MCLRRCYGDMTHCGRGSDRDGKCWRCDIRACQSGSLTFGKDSVYSPVRDTGTVEIPKALHSKI